MTKRAAHYAPRIAKDICREIAMGATLKEALNKVGYLAPTMPTFWRWLDEHADFREMYERARMLQADSDADRMRELAEDVIRNPRQATAIRVATDILKWQAEVRNKSKYGSKSEDPKSHKPLNPAELRTEIKRLEKELGVAESQGTPKPVSIFPLRKA